MFLSEVIKQERRHSSAIKMNRRGSEVSDTESAEATPRRRSELIRRRSSLFRPPPPIEPTFTWRNTNDEHWVIVQDDGSETTLVYRKTQASSMKNFGIEVRGIRDVDNLLDDAVIILRPKSVVLSDLIEEILEHVQTSVNGDDEFHQEVRKELFTDVNGNWPSWLSQILLSLVLNDTNIYFNSSYICQHFARICQEGISASKLRPIIAVCFPAYFWMFDSCDLSQIKKRYVAIARMKQPTNFGETCQEVRFFILVMCPSKTVRNTQFLKNTTVSSISKETKTALETSRTFATLFSDPNLRNSLLQQPTEENFKDALSNWAAKISAIAEDQGAAAKDDYENRGVESLDKESNKSEKEKCCWGIGSGIFGDLKRRLPHYVSDYTDGVADARAVQKTISTSVFLYFACLLPTIAFATLNSQTTHGKMDVRKGIFSQTVGQLIFAFIGGQHLSILLTTAPLSLFVYIIYSLSEFFSIVDQFEAFYCCVGLWTSLFLFLSAIFNMSKVMKYCTRSTEEIFALFISIAFMVYAVKDTVHEFQHNYNSEACPTNQNHSFVLQNNETVHNTVYKNLPHESGCHRESSLLYLLLMFGTFWFGYTLYNFKNTPFLQRSKREILSDYSLPLAVVLFSFIGSFLFQDIPARQFAYDQTKPLLQLAQVDQLDWQIILLSGALGFCLAVLIFMDQNIGSAIVNNPSNKLKKGPSYHWDLVVISIINCFCSLFALPWLHVALPHAPMHVKCLADVEERVEHGQVKETVVLVRETRLTTIISHILMGFSLYLLPYPLSYILPSVFDGLYLYMGITALGGNQMFERILLFFTEQMSYPPNHYIRQVPQRKIHQFTLIQVVQLLILCILGFFPFPFVKVLFPLVLLFLLYSRQKLLPMIIEKKYLQVLD